MSENAEYVMYDNATGEVRAMGLCQVDMVTEQIPPSGTDLLQVAGVDPVMQYIEIGTEQVLSRPVVGSILDKGTINSDGVDVATISDVAIGTTVTVYLHGFPITSFLVDDGNFEFTSTEIGAYRIVLINFPYQEEEHQVDVI